MILWLVVIGFPFMYLRSSNPTIRMRVTLRGEL